MTTVILEEQEPLKIIKILKVLHGLKTKELAELTNTSYTNLIKLEQGRRTVSTNFALQLANHFNLDKSILMETVTKYNSKFRNENDGKTYK